MNEKLYDKGKNDLIEKNETKVHYEEVDGTMVHDKEGDESTETEKKLMENIKEGKSHS